jgi:shikimate kinase
MKPLTPTTPHVIMMVGIPGSGKTTFAEHFAKTFQAPYINPGTISEEIGLDADATEKVTKLLFDELLKTNRTLIYEGSTFTKSQRFELIKHVSKAGYETLLVWVQTEPYEAKRRATHKTKAGALSSEDFDEIFQGFQNPSAAEKPVVISGKHTYTTQLKTVLKHLSRNAPDTQVPPAPQQPIVRTGRNIIIR